MKIVQKNVYYCEFCKKRSLSGSHMSTHEKHCTANPNRKCRMCENGFDIGKIVTEFKTRFTLELTKIDDYEDLKAKWTGEPVTLDEVRKRVKSCPNCMLAIIRQCQFAYHYFEDMGFETFDYEAEMNAAMAERNHYVEDWY